MCEAYQKGGLEASVPRSTGPFPGERRSAGGAPSKPGRSRPRQDDDPDAWSTRPTRAERRRVERTERRTGRRGRTPVWVWWVGGGVAALAVLMVIVVATRSSSASRPAPPSGVQTFDEKDRNHVTTPVTYDRTPPAGGNHAPRWLDCGVYDRPVPNENAVHSLEHGSVWVTYQPSLSAADVQSLRTLVASKYDGAQRYLILSPYPGLPAPVVATAWGAQLSMQSASDPRLAQFIDYYREGPQDLEPGAACSGGVGDPMG